jgi:thiol-disulfide isomerase/thioredoxin
VRDATQAERTGGRPLDTIRLLAGCACLALAFGCSQQSKSPAEKPSAQTITRSGAPPQVTQIDDAKIKELLKPNGKPLLVNFWATWCGPCREEFPDLVRIDAEYRPRIDFITVSLDFPEELNTSVPQFLTEMNAQMPAYLLTSSDENTLISTISKNWNGALPFTILYNKQGHPAFTRQGKVDHQTLKNEIEKAISE